MNCPLCGDLLSERGNYCKACGGQARCMDCRAVLEPGAAACVECGTRVGQRGNSVPEGTQVGTNAIAPNRNTISYHEDRSSRRLDASLTDDAMQGIGGILGDLFVQRGSARAIAARQMMTDHQVIEAQTELPLLPTGSPAISPPASPVATSQSLFRSAEELAELFTTDGEKLELSDNRLKASNQSDYVRRLTYLFLYAHECQGRLSTTEDDLKAVLRENKVWDRAGNAAKWLKRRIGVANDGEDRLKLTTPGREEAKKTLAQALDTNIADAWNPDKQAASKQRAPRGVKKA